MKTLVSALHEDIFGEALTKPACFASFPVKGIEVIEWFV